MVHFYVRAVNGPRKRPTGGALFKQSTTDGARPSCCMPFGCNHKLYFSPSACARTARALSPGAFEQLPLSGAPGGRPSEQTVYTDTHAPAAVITTMYVRVR